jgi:hypothetical protein
MLNSNLVAAMSTLDLGFCVSEKVDAIGKCTNSKIMSHISCIRARSEKVKTTDLHRLK